MHILSPNPFTFYAVFIKGSEKCPDKDLNLGPHSNMSAHESVCIQVEVPTGIEKTCTHARNPQKRDLDVWTDQQRSFL